MFPLYDDNPTTRRPYVTIALMGACIVAFVWQMSLGPRGGQLAVYSLGFIPAVFIGEAELPRELALVPASATLVTSMFLHGGLMHLVGNMLYLWVFGNNIEDACGHGRFLAFYLLCGVAAALVQAIPDLDSEIPMIGASGAISGVLGAYLLLFPHARVYVLIPFGFLFVQPVPAGPDHRPPQLVQPAPCRLVAAQSQHPLDAQRTDAVLLAGHIPDRPEPQRQRQAAALEDRAGRHRRLMPTAGTQPQPPAGRPRLAAAAAGTDKAVGPAKREQILSTRLLAGEAFLQFHQRARILFHEPERYRLGQVESSGYPVYVMSRPCLRKRHAEGSRRSCMVQW